MKRREDYADVVKIKDRFVRRVWRRKTKNPSQQTSTAKSESTVSQDPVKEPNELTRKEDGNGILLQTHQARLRHGGNQQINGGRHRAGVNSEFFNPKLQGVSLTNNGGSLVIDGGVQILHHTCAHSALPHT